MDGGLLRLSGIRKHFQASEGGGELLILNQLELEVRAGESIAIIGPSGSGKSTLLNIIGTLERPDAGEVQLQGRPLAGLTDVQLAEVRNQQIGLVFQSHHLLPQCTVLENVLVPTLPLKNGNPQAAEQRARELLSKVGLGERFGHYPGQLSGGERQRVALVRALINKPALLLADEPTGALDRASARNLSELLIKVNVEEKSALIVVTHAPELARLMQRTYQLQEGKLVPYTEPK